jgi:hypothetical protein
MVHMGLDGTIKRLDGEPLGELVEVKDALAIAFPGIVFGLLPSGVDKIRLAAERGIAFPESLREQLERIPARNGGDYEGPDFSAQFSLGTSKIVQQIDVILYGNTVASGPMFAVLEERFGWVTTHP